MSDKNKLKTAKRRGMRKLLIKSIKGQQISENELYSINSDKVSGLIHAEVYKSGSSFTLEYDITGYVSLADFLQMPMCKEIFARVLQNILDNLKSMEKAYFNQRLVLMDIDWVLVNPATQAVFFIYVPVQPFESESDLRTLLLDVIQYCSFSGEEDMSYVQEYITILNEGVNFSVFDLEQYVNMLTGGKEDVRYVECPKCRTMIPEDASICSVCGYKLYGNTGGFSERGKVRGGSYVPPTDIGDDINDEKDIIMPDAVDKKNHRTKETESKNEQVDIVEDMPQEKPENGKKGGTVVLQSGTTVLGDEQEKYPYLLREKTGETIVVDKPSFRIGSEYRDYIITDNKYISRSHADIVSRGGRYFIIDLNSTNRTYIDGIAVKPEQQTELFDGSVVKLANEKFKFCIE